MTKANYSELVIILDRSGSMETIKKDVIGGFNSFIEEQRKIPGECRISLHQFDNTFETVYECRDLANVPPLDLIPRGGTALYDAVARAFDLTGRRLAAMPEHERPDRVAVLIITDGQENSSVESTAKEVMNRVVEQKTKYSWSVSYLGADESAFKVADKLGIGASNAVYWRNTSAGTGAVFDSLSKSFSKRRVAHIADVGTGAMFDQADYERALDNRTQEQSNGSP